MRAFVMGSFSKTAEDGLVDTMLFWNGLVVNDTLDIKEYLQHHFLH
jgi:hypothetical protein